MKQETRLRWVRAGGLYDLLVSWPLLTPWSLAWMSEQLNTANQALGLAGQASVPDGQHALLAGLLASLILLWGGVRALWPSEQLGSWDALTRLLFATQLIAAALSGQPQLLLVYAAMELLFGAMQWGGLSSLGSAAAVPRYPAASRS
ncbi:hypothetical protein HNQ51_003692 [Inhella inkyongensis]|uniref:Uncharacterized protein n=1 Tax=Inhella inkyongensis TaxID=392593 RepID=A0A840SBG6_9BURK|nr:hypothetical protein [Inhella inkyongensis]MBB5206346.1 hypothetical protein [Inhella inkyongensis]